MNEQAPRYITQRILEGENPVQVWRDHRCMPLDALAKKVGLTPWALVELEIDGQAADPASLASIAGALRVPVEHLMVPPRNNQNCHGPHHESQRPAAA